MLLRQEAGDIADLIWIGREEFDADPFRAGPSNLTGEVDRFVIKKKLDLDDISEIEAMSRPDKTASFTQVHQQRRLFVQEGFLLNLQTGRASRDGSILDFLDGIDQPEDLIVIVGLKSDTVLVGADDENHTAEQAKLFVKSGECHLDDVRIAKRFVTFDKTSAETQLFDGRSNVAINSCVEVDIDPNEFTSFVSRNRHCFILLFGIYCPGMGDPKTF